MGVLGGTRRAALPMRAGGPHRASAPPALSRLASPAVAPALGAVASPEAFPATFAFPPEAILRLQRTAGNGHVARLLARRPLPAVPPGGAVQREIGKGKSGWEVKHTRTDARYVAYSHKAAHYQLRPLSGALEVGEVAETNAEYEAVGVHKVGDITSITDDDARRGAARDASEWGTAAAAAAIAAGDMDTAMRMFERVADTLDLTRTLPPSTERKSQKDLDTALRVTHPNAKFLQDVLRVSILLPQPQIIATLEAHLLKDQTRLKKLIKDVDQAAVRTIVATELAQAVVDFRSNRAQFEPYLPYLAGVARQQSVESYEKALPSPLRDPDFTSAFGQMSEVKLKQEKKGAATYDESKIDAVATTEVEKAEARTKYSILSHLGEPIDAGSLRLSLDEILLKAMGVKAQRLKHLFAESPTLLDEAAKQVKEDNIHRLLLAIKQGKPHSVHDINDYVGDKLNEPLMRWIVDKGIPVEIHATSLLASFARLKSEGFTDLIEIPSTHTGTNKYVVSNPQTGLVKVVFQTLSGTSYAVQASGPFLFYELYSIEPSVADKVAPTKKEFVYGDFKAQKIIADDASRSVATFLLVNKDTHQTLGADVPYVGKPPKIDANGAILLVGTLPSAVDVHKVQIRSMSEKNLKVFKEDVDYTKVYAGIFKTYGIDKAHIAALGQKGSLKKLLKDSDKVEPQLEVQLPYFNMSVFRLKSAPEAKTLLLFGVSPDFFGDKSGHLIEALKGIAVEHITFVGTAGGTQAGVETGELMIPEATQNIAEGHDRASATKYPNEAHALLTELKTAGGPDAKVKSGGRHVGVHAVITESMEMIKWMQSTDVSSVDCEAGFIADALKDSGVKLYSIFYIGDVPGTSESIGMGGIAASDTTTTTPITPTTATATAPKANPSELMVRKIIELVVKQKIEGADKAARKEKYAFNRARMIEKVKFPAMPKAREGKIGLRLMLPAIAELSEDKESLAGLLKLFTKRISALIEGAPDEIVTPPVQETINKMAQAFYREHRVMIEVTFE